MRVAPMWKALLVTLPSSLSLEERDWLRRHRLLLNLLAVHVPLLAVLGGLTGHSVLAMLAATVVPALCVWFGHLLRRRRREAAVLVTFGLVWCSAALVGLTSGTIEAHFHFFIVIGFVAVYLDWIPLLFMILFTILSHALGSQLSRDLIFTHPAGQANPWLWSLIHGVAVLAACIGIVHFWNVTEDVTARNVLARRLAEAGRREFAADLLINLARRNQSMLYRQLEIINQLEESERDPDKLAELFALDHLATRVRRNAESLLVLAGQQPPRVVSRPVPIREVLNAAITETEDLERVLITIDEDPAVIGHVVTDLTHLIAELTENAVRFSPPDTTVSVRARTNQQQPGGVLLAVEDWGVGMPAPQLAAANALLAKPPEVDASVSQRLGFHVVARLAARHGISVSLRALRGAGITATIVLPPAVFAAAGADPDPIEPAVPNAQSRSDATPTTSIPSVHRPEPAVVGGAAQGQAGPWFGWWAADLEPATADSGSSAAGRRAAGDAGGSEATRSAPSPRPRGASPPPTESFPVCPPQADRRSPTPADPPVDPVSGLHKRVPQAHLAPGLRQPEPRSEGSLQQRAGQLSAGTIGNEHGWLS